MVQRVPRLRQPLWSRWRLIGANCSPFWALLDAERRQRAPYSRLERVDAGNIEIDGTVVASTSIHVPPERRRVGMVFQEYALFPHVNVLANVQFGLRRMAADARAARTKEVLELAGLAAWKGVCRTS